MTPVRPRVVRERSTGTPFAARLSAPQVIDEIAHNRQAIQREHESAVDGGATDAQQQS
jgi:hypothetical protein